jgi:hypothetical protein
MAPDYPVQWRYERLGEDSSVDLQLLTFWDFGIANQEKNLKVYHQCGRLGVCSAGKQVRAPQEKLRTDL